MKFGQYVTAQGYKWNSDSSFAQWLHKTADGYNKFDRRKIQVC